MEKTALFIKKYIIYLVIIIGCILRLLYIGRVPGNTNYFQDEAFSAYEAYSMVNYGMDSHGYHNPVYLKTWGSGMSALQCYIQTFFIRALGFTPVATRLPQALLGCITLVFFYLLIKELTNKSIAFWSTFILAICPWHITMSRWGLDCNYYIGFITIALYLIVISRNSIWKTILAAVFTAIALYSYASPWLVMPLLVYGTLAILYFKKEISIKSIIIFTIVLGILAIPLFLFVLVNLGLIPEIRTNIISIPKLSVFRGDEVQISLEKIKNMFAMFWNQYDYISYDSTPKYGIYFLFSNIFVVIGLLVAIVKRQGKTAIMLLWFGCGLIMGLTIDPNFERLNILILPLIFFIGVGIDFATGLLKKYSDIGCVAIFAIYVVVGTQFAHYYFTEYNEMIERVWPDGAQEAIEYSQNYSGTIHVNDIRHPIILCYSKYPVDKYVQTVVYEDENARFLQPLSFEGYDLTDFSNQECVSGDIYICNVEDAECVDWLVNNDMAVYAQFGEYYVGVAK